MPTTMLFAPTPDQAALRDSFRRFCAAPETQRSGAGGARKTWRALADMGIPGVLVPEHLGGSEGSLADAAIVSQELGRSLILSPFLPVAVLTARFLTSGPTAGRASQVLERLTDGNGITVLAHDEDRSRGLPATRAVALGGKRFLLNGAKALVPFADIADTYLISTRLDADGAAGDGPAFFCVDARTPGVSCAPLHLLDGTPVANVSLTDVSLDAEALVSPPGASLQRLLAAQRSAAVCACAEMVGIMDGVLSAVRAHLGARSQYGAALNTFQVLQHRFADMYAATELARAMLQHMLVADVDPDRPPADGAAAAAFAYVAAKG